MANVSEIEDIQIKIAQRTKTINSVKNDTTNLSNRTANISETEDMFNFLD